MYSEIKNNRQVLINRLTDSERILLKDIYDLSKISTISLKELDDETGDFSGVIMTITPEEPKELLIEGTIATSLEIFQKEKFTYTFPVDNDVTILIDNDNDNMMVTSKGNELSMIASEPLQDVIKYEISKDGYKHIHGEIAVNAILRDKAKVTFNIIPEGIYNVRVCDDNCTHYFSNNGVYELPIGKYHVFVSSINHRYEKQEFEVTEEDIININKEVEIDLVDLNDTCRVVFKQSNTNTYGRVKMVVVNNATGKKLLNSSIDPSFGIEVYHLPVGEYTYSVESEKDMWTMEPTQLVISKDDIKTEKTISVVLIETNPIPDKPDKPEPNDKVEVKISVGNSDAVKAGAKIELKNSAGEIVKPYSQELAGSEYSYELVVGTYTIVKTIPEGYKEDDSKEVVNTFDISQTEIDNGTTITYQVNIISEIPELDDSHIYYDLIISSVNGPTLEEIRKAVSINLIDSDAVFAEPEVAYSIKDETLDNNRYNVTYSYVVKKSTQYRCKITLTDSDDYTYQIKGGNDFFFNTGISNSSKTVRISKQSK